VKKYAPFIFLLVGATAIFVIKTNQRGPAYSSQDKVNVDIPAAITTSDTTAAVDTINQGFDRHATIIYSKHSRCRMECRHITEDEVKEILLEGKLNARKEKEDDRGITYPLEGMADGHHLRIVFAPKEEDEVEVVTCIDLDTDWPCDCK
jgi:hypothetical protein